MKLAPFAMKLCNDANAPAIAELMQSEHVPTPFHVTGKEQHTCWCEPEMTAMCPDCEGTGYRNKMPCRGCGCRGRFTVENPALADSIRHRTIPVREI